MPLFVCVACLTSVTEVDLIGQDMHEWTDGALDP